MFTYARLFASISVLVLASASAACSAPTGNEPLAGTSNALAAKKAADDKCGCDSSKDDGSADSPPDNNKGEGSEKAPPSKVPSKDPGKTPSKPGSDCEDDDDGSSYPDKEPPSKGGGEKDDDGEDCSDCNDTPPAKK